MDGQAAEEQLREAVTRAVFNKQWTRNVVEIIIPIVIELKATLESARSPFVQDLFHYLKTVSLILVSIGLILEQLSLVIEIFSLLIR